MPEIAIAGAGPVALALGRALTERGTLVACVASRNPEHAEQAARFIGGGARALAYAAIPEHATHVLIAVSDRGIAPVAASLAGVPGRLQVALHTCGSYGPELLAPLASAGVACGGLHPLQTLRDGAQGAAALPGSAFAVCGDALALAWAEAIVATLSGRVLHIAPDARQLYHAAAVMASNYLAVVLDCAEQLMRLAGVPPADALGALAPLARTSLENALRDGPAAALTGPVVRGDAATVAAHLAVLEGSGMADLYKAAGVYALRLARARGLRHAEAARVEQALLGGR